MCAFLVEHPRQISDLAMEPINATSMVIFWTPPIMANKCYMISKYAITCNFGFRDVVRSVDGTNVYTRVLSGLLPDTTYTCSVSQCLEDRDGNVASFNVTPITQMANTRPMPLDPSSILDISAIESDGMSEPGTITISLANVRTVSSVSHIRIYVLRLVSFTLPDGSPDTLYTHESDFSTYWAARSGMGKFKPYLAAEFDFQDIPLEFVIGSGEGLGTTRQSDQPINLMLQTDASYTAFVRAYSVSQFRRQYDVYTSSEFMPPTAPVREVSAVKDDGASSSTASIVASVVVIVLLLLVMIAITVLILVLMRRR